MSSPESSCDKSQEDILSTSDIWLRRNNFDLLRFLFALVVFLVHAYVLSGVESLSLLGKFFCSGIAVKSFFVVSGFLIFMSYENTENGHEYFMKRVRRIYPAYFFVILGIAVLGGIFTTYPLGEYISLPVLKYVAANLVFLNFLQPILPGLFENNTLQAVNGALWTIKIEVMFYFFVPLVVVAFRKFGRMPVMVTLYIASVMYSVLMEELARQTGGALFLVLQHQLPGQLVFFIAGAAGYYWFQYLAKYRLWLLVISVSCFVLQYWLSSIVILPVALGGLVLYFACFFPCVGNFGKYGDFSYGIYIVHFPILQILISHGLFKESPWLMLIIAGLLVMIVAVFLWYFIEKPFLRKSSHYVAVNQG